MKFQIEILDADIESLLAAAVRVEVAKVVGQKIYSFDTSNRIRRAIEDAWPATLQRVVEEVMQDLPTVKATAQEMMQRKLQAQLTRAMKQAQLNEVSA